MQLLKYFAHSPCGSKPVTVFVNWQFCKSVYRTYVYIYIKGGQDKG